MTEMDELRAAAADHARAEERRERLRLAIIAALATGETTVAEVARISGYNREHVRRIRDGKQI